MSRSVLTDADGIVGEDEDDRQLHQRREADRRLHIIRENQIARTERPELREGKAVADGAHSMLAYAEMKVGSSIGVGLRSEDRSVGKECVSKCGSRGAAYH